MANRELESLYDYTYEDHDDDDDPYLYSPRITYEDAPDDQRTVDTEEVSIPHRLEDTEYPVTQSVPFYGRTTNNAAYTWKVPHAREKREITESETGDAPKIPFYSETTHRSQYQPFDASVARTRLSRKASALPVSNVPLDTQTTYRNLFQELEIGKRQKLIQTCPAEKLIHQTALLRSIRRENGHYFLSAEALRSSKYVRTTAAAPTQPSTLPVEKSK
ncbi:uncharacterized protein CELE_H13N06.7 [Caenorhabditis elegans]|uniref:Uncharacterized protein n=1 Tax=Caenorhabditis elegans TaxID=6239 RepID=Q564P8_CAEEL|nr:Uncharacterized protein CELE_H13N06.7 [Caenorhabditis elegans]CAI79199.2 Uncharacterized protein CELE_H13N06.7 [Caenorhabditis elegans]|eukprot:NP_001024737.2 Uncharacterized protein CELE_H13N06.7 [Caenorhabditis elegans]